MNEHLIRIRDLMADIESAYSIERALPVSRALAEAYDRMRTLAAEWPAKEAK